MRERLGRNVGAALAVAMLLAACGSSVTPSPSPSASPSSAPLPSAILLPAFRVLPSPSEVGGSGSFIGQLTQVGDCLVADSSQTGARQLIVWPIGYALATRGVVPEVDDASGKKVTGIGDTDIFTGLELPAEGYDDLAGDLSVPIPDGCRQPGATFWFATSTVVRIPAR